jgi:hypothetical protein
MKDANFGMAPRGALANPMLHLDEIARQESSKEIIAAWRMITAFANFQPVQMPVLFFVRRS